MRLSTLAICTALTVLGGCAPTPGPAASGADSRSRVCFAPRSLTNFRADGEAILYVRAGVGRVFEIQTGGCRGLGMAQSIVVSPGPGRGSSACVGDTVDLATAGPSLMGENNSRCRARVSRVLTDEEVAALPGRVRP